MTKPRWKHPDERMARAVELRERGWSLRRIGDELVVGVATIHRDLARWERERPQDARPVLRLVPSAFHPTVPSVANGTPQRNTDGTPKEETR